MRSIIQTATAVALISAGTASAVHADEVLVSSNITTSTTWTSDNTYNLQGQIYVLPGATLTIQAGTVVASDTGGGGSLAVTKGARIFVNGTRANPVIMTSKADVATWGGGRDGEGKDSRIGTWREGVNEWGNLTIMGGAYISEDATPGNTAVPDPDNVAAMEGLVNGPSTDLYGGGDDDDNSGSISFLSLRFGGRVVNLNNELNGLSLGGVGRDTDIRFVDIMNNVDDGIEIWGGCVNIKYFNIWNIGDDSFDVDQGWRGQAQFGLIVQGFSTNDSQGSGVGDNIFETDGAEDSDWQPVTTAAIYNCTAIGQPIGGDDGTAWRDNARVQYGNCIWMDLGEELVRFDNDDGDGASGYGHAGTLSWPATWTTSAAVTSPVNPFPGSPSTYYKAQHPAGNLAQIRDSVFFRNLNGAAYTEAAARGVLAAGNRNTIATQQPIRRIVRAAPVVRGGLTMLQVIGLDPRAANDAVSRVGAAPSNAFFSPVNFAGAFHPNRRPWVCGWTAADQFGFLEPCKVAAPQRGQGTPKLVN